MLPLSVTPDAPEPALIARAAEILRGGGIVAYPTDTVYGLAVDPRSVKAVERLFAVKGRDAAAAIPLIASSIEDVEQVGALTSDDLRLARAFWPGPLTLVVSARQTLHPRVTGGGTTVAVRVPAHAVARALASSAGFPITATSANRSGRPPSMTSDEVAAAFGDDIDLLLDGGPTIGGPPSTIVEMEVNGPRLLRVGAIAWDRVLESLK
jgi:L-threonylcarbamoyladenylate synthase